MQQQHSGSGDNVAGNKTTINNISIPKLIGFTLLGLSLFVVAYLLWPAPVYLSGYVYSSGGQPVEGASLAVRTPGGEEYQSVTNGTGFFQFDGLAIGEATTARLTVQADVRELQLSLDTIALTENGLRLRLPPGTPPFRITYYNLGAHAIDQVLQGKLREDLGGTLAQNTILISNAVQDYYRKLLNEHGMNLDEYFYIQRPWREVDPATELSTRDLYQRTDRQADYLPGKGGTASADLEVNAELSREQVQALLRSEVWTQVSDFMPDSVGFDYIPENSGMLAVAWLDKASWQQLSQAMLVGSEAAMERYLEASRGWEGEYADTPEYRDHLRQEYLRGLRRNIAFWNTLIGADLPPQLIGAEITQGAGCAVATFHARLKLPELFLQVAVLENTTDQAIQLDTFVFRTQAEAPLRPEPAVLAAWAEAPVQRERLFPQEQLAPGEKLVIPRYFYAQANEYAYLAREEAALFGIRSPAFIQDPARDRPAYIFGPAFRIETVLLGPERYAFRGFDRDRLVLIDGVEAGSCPYAYSRAHAGGPWRLEGHLIYGHRKRAWEGTDTLKLHRFDGQLLIRERDPETSFLREVYLVVHRANGNRETFQPGQSILQRGQSDYFIMNQGDSLLLDFPNFEPRAGDRYRLVNAGYYLPYRPRVSYRFLAAAARVRGEL